MEFRLLGPVEVWMGGRQLAVRGSQRRALLAVLLLHANRVISTDHLISLLWQKAPPKTARTALQWQVYQLRQLLSEDGGAAEDRLVFRAPGYRLRVRSGELDLEEFQRLADQGREALAAGRAERADDLLRSALRLWRGQALEDVTAMAVVAQRATLEERRLAALEDRIEADLALGRHTQLVAELDGLVAANPLRERMWGQLMVALYRAGRQADALHAFRSVRGRLVEELGVEPGRPLQELQRRILVGDSTLDHPARPAGPPQLGFPPGPRQLPPDIPSFTGRSAELRRLHRRFAGFGDRGPAMIVAIHGSAGIGKSVLAVHAAHRLEKWFPDGQLYVNLQGAAAGLEPLEPLEVLGRFLRGLGVNGARIPTQVDEAAAWFRSMLAGRRLLVVLDNARDAAQVTPLLPGSPGCAVLVTSRPRLSGLDGASHLHLGLLSAEEAVALIAKLSDRRRVDAEPAAAAAVARWCGYLPLALRISAARLAMHSHHRLSWLAERLADERRRLDELAVGDLEVRASLALCYQALEPERQRLLRLLGLLQAPDWAGWVVAALLDARLDDAERSLERMVEAHLVEVAGIDGCGQVRYRLHDLVRLYAREQLEHRDPAAERAAPLERALGGWLALVEQAVPRLGGDWFGFVPGAGSARRWHPGPALTGRLLSHPLTWMEAERSALLAAVLQASAAGLDGLAWQLAVGVSLFYEMRGYSNDWRRSHEVALAATQHAGTLQGQGFLLTRLGELHLFQGGPLDEAMEHFQRASDLFEQCGDRYGHAVAVYGTGTVHRRRGRLGPATTDFHRTLIAFEELGDHQGVSYSLHGLAGVQRQQGRLVEAAACLERAMAASKSTGNRRGQAQALLGLARLHRDLGRVDQALSFSGRALAAFEELGERFGEVHARHNLAELYLDQGHLQEADDLLGKCLATFREMDDAGGEALTLHSMGELRRRRSQLHEAADCLQRSLGIWQELQEPSWQARALDSLGEVHAIAGNCQGASAAWREALALFEQLDSPQAEKVRSRLSALAPK